MILISLIPFLRNNHQGIIENYSWPGNLYSSLISFLKIVFSYQCTFFPRLNIASIVAGLFRGYGLLVLLKWYRVIQKATLSLLCKRHTRVKLVSKVEQSTCITVIMPFYKSNYSTVLFSPIFKSWENSNSAV